MLGIFVVTLVRMILQWHANNKAPRLTVNAVVVEKHESVSQTQQPVGGDATGAHGVVVNTTITYHVTFAVESGDRMEFQVPDAQYGLMIEGDRGRLTFQGTRFLSFERR